MWLIPLAFLKHLKVFYMSSVLSCEAVSGKILFALLMLPLYITAVRTEAQVPHSQEEQCRKVFAFHDIFLHHTVWSIKALYTRNDSSYHCDRKANCLILSNLLFSLICKVLHVISSPKSLWVILLIAEGDGNVFSKQVHLDVLWQRWKLIHKEKCNVLLLLA